MALKKLPTMAALEAVAEKVASRLAHDGIEHLLIGGLAVARFGYPRVTADVDFLLSEEGLAQIAGTPNAIGLSERIDGVRVDYIAAEAWESNLIEALEVARPGETISVFGLVYLKLKANRKKDQADVVELVKRGMVPLRAARKYLASIGDPDLVAGFNLAVLEAESEGD